MKLPVDILKPLSLNLVSLDRNCYNRNNPGFVTRQEFPRRPESIKSVRQDHD